MVDERKIVCVREGSSMVSTWNEYLCVANIAPGVARIDVCGYEALREHEGEDEDGNELPMPREVDGKTVVGVEDGWLVGGALDCYDADKQRTYTVNDLEEVLGWLKTMHFEVSDEMMSEIRAAAACR